MSDNRATEQGLNNSLYDAALSSVWSSLCGGIFLTGFALQVLRADAQSIGLLAALPTIANLVQLLGSYLVEATGDRKRLCVACVLIQRVLWLLIILLPLEIFPHRHSDWKIWLLVLVVGLSSLCGSLAGVAWVAWMSDFVPERIRGAYFGKRNMIASAAALVATLAGGQLLAHWESWFGSTNPYGFVILFSIGLLAGVAAIPFLFRVPDFPLAGSHRTGLELQLFLRPFRDPHFLRLLLFITVTTFSLQLAAPFYGVYLIEVLKVDFGTITLLGALATGATLIMMKIWGPICDRQGNKPIIVVSGMVLMLVPLLWIGAVPGGPVWPVLLAHILTGAASAGLSLSQFNIQIKLSPQAGRSVYLAVIASISGIVGGVAPVVGGTLHSTVLSGLRFQMAGYEFSGYHFLFLFSMGLLGISLPVIRQVREIGAATPYTVILQLRNDLDPQTGVASFMDFAMVELKRTESVLQKVDHVTDELAARSEKFVEQVVDQIAHFLEPFWKKLKEFFRSV
ncbi:MAG: MFS transporter [Nitrospirae bacterium]|nr:MAG: MFS transporter [Nitrospirota bacterium]